MRLSSWNGLPRDTEQFRLSKLTIAVLISSYSPFKIDCFSVLDADKNGYLDFKEFQQVGQLPLDWYYDMWEYAVLAVSLRAHAQRSICGRRHNKRYDSTSLLLDT
jgi:hypothetical protein